MSEEIKVGASASGEDQILKLVSAIDHLGSSLDKLGNSNTALGQLQKQMAAMQAQMTTGFAEMANLAAGGAERIRKASEDGANKQLRDQIRFEEKQHAQANKHHHKMRELQDTWHLKQREDYVKFWQGVLAEQLKAEAKQSATQQRRDLEMHNMATKANNSYVSLWEKMLTQRQQIQERRDKEMHDARTRDANDYVKFWEKQLAAQEAAQAKQLALARQQQVDLHRIRAAEEERARNLNVNYLTASPASQLRTATKAQVYAQQGGNAAEKFGSAAASADVAALRRQIDALPGAVDRSRDAIDRHNVVMREGHSLARGLAGSLGGLWLTYGSLVPLVAGAALAATLKGVVETGKEVEHQLNFVASLTGQGVNLDSFINITDKSLRSVTEAANAMRALAQNGLSASQSLQVLPSVLQLATVGEMDVAQAALAVTGATAAFGLQFTEAERVADIFAKTAATSNTSVLAMTESMKQASTASSLFKVSVEETAGMLGLLAKINITGGAAGTSFTNLLTGLYEPTNQGKKALKELGVEIQTAGGALKPFTQLMEELRSALGGFNDHARVDYLGSIFTVRGVKAAELALQNLEEYKTKVTEAGEASGFMAGVLRKLEDDTDGAFKRLSVAVENTFVAAFKEAAPYVQQIGLHLGDAFKENGTQSGIANLATNVARLTGYVIDNAGAVGTLLVAYAAFRMMNGAGGVISLITAASNATVVSTAATAAATVAQGAHATAMAAGTATTATFTAATEAQAAATAAATAASRAWMATLVPALGAVAVAVGAAAALWLLLRDNTSEAEKVNVQIGNSIHTVTEQLDKEIERLKESNALWDERNMRFRDPATGSAQAISAAQTQVADIEHNMRSRGMDPEQVLKGRQRKDADGQWYTDFSKEALELMTARSNLAKLVQQENRGLFTVEPARALEKTRQAAAQLREELEKYDARAIGTDSFGNMIVQNEKARDLMTDMTRGASALRTQLMDPSQQLADPVKELNRINSIRASLDKLKEDVNGTLADKPAKQDKKAENDGFRAMLQAQKNAADAAADIAKKTQAGYDSLYKTGELSAIDYYTQTRDLSIKTAQERLAAFNEEERISAMRENRTADVVKAKGRQAQAQREIDDAELVRLRGLNEYVYAEEKRRTQFEAEELRKRGELVAAYQKENAPELQKLELNVTSSQNRLDQARADGNLPEIGLATKVRDAALSARDAWLSTLAVVAQTEAFQKAEKSFDLLMSGLNTSLAELQEKNSEGAGLASIFDNALVAEERYSTALSGLMEKQRALAEIASRDGATDEQKKGALDALKEIESAGARMRGIWKDVGRDLEQSLTRAFGNSGKAAGGLIRTTMDLANRRKKIEDDLVKSSKGADPESLAKLQAKAARDSASAQISAYGDMAGAAKGFFDENSRGYAAMEAAERGFRVLELVLAAESMAKKLFFKESEVAANVALNATKVSGEAAASNASTALAGTEASAWGVTAVVKALASLPFPANLAAGAATLAAVVSIGAKMFGSVGGGSVSVTEQRQAEQGTGTVLGAKDAKSESISNSLDMIEKLTFQDLAIAGDMRASLRSIEANIGSFASLLVRTTGVQGDFGADMGKNVFDSKAIGIGGAAVGGLAGAAAGAYVGMGTSYIGAMLGGPLGMALGSVLGAVIGKTFIGKALGSVFGGKKTVEDTGFSMNSASYGSILANGASAYQYADIKEDGGWFSSDKRSTEKAGLDAEGNRQITSVLKSLYDTVAAAGALLELNTDDFSKKLNGFVVDIGKISLKDKTGEEIQEELTAAFSKVGDQLAQFGVGGLEQFQKVGEGYLETLVRVAANYQAVSVVMQSLGMQFNSVGLDSIAARERLVELAGGLDNFTSSAEQFLNDFYTEQERAAKLQERIQPTLNQFGLSTTGSDPLKAFRDVLTSLDTTTEAGAKDYTALMEIAPAFKSIIDASGTTVKTAKDIADEAKELQDQLDELVMTPTQLLEKERNQLDPSNRGLFDQIQAAKQGKEFLDAALSLDVRALEASGQKVKAVALQRANELATLDKATRALRQYEFALEDLETARSGLQEAYDREVGTLETLRDRFKEVGKSLRDFLTGLDTGELSNLDPKGKYDAAKSEFDRLYQLAKGGDVEALEKLQGAAEAFLEQSKEYNATGQAYTSDLEMVKAAIANAANGADKQVSIAEQQLDEMKRLVTGIVDLNTNMVSFADALKQYNTAKAVADQAGAGVASGIGGTASDAIEMLYRSVFGRASDTEGKAFWLEAYKNGVSLSTIQSEFLKSEEYAAMPRRANGGHTRAGQVLVGERGPEIVNFDQPGMVYTAPQTQEILSGGLSSADVSALIEEQRLTREALERELGAANVQRAAVAAATTEKLAELSEQMESVSRTIDRNN